MKLTPNEERALAEQLQANPLFRIMLDELETSAIERLINAKEQDMLAAQLRVQAVRAFRADVMERLRVQEPKSAPA